LLRHKAQRPFFFGFSCIDASGQANVASIAFSTKGPHGSTAFGIESLKPCCSCSMKSFDSSEDRVGRRWGALRFVQNLSMLLLSFSFVAISKDC